MTEKALRVFLRKVRKEKIMKKISNKQLIYKSFCQAFLQQGYDLNRANELATNIINLTQNDRYAEAYSKYISLVVSNK
jgi:hypothetical protein